MHRYNIGATVSEVPAPNLFLPVLPLGEACLFPESSMEVVVTAPAALKAVEMAALTGGRLLAVANRDADGSPRDVHEVGTVAVIASEDIGAEGGRRIGLDGTRRARVVSLVGMDVLVAETTMLEDGDSGDDWGAAVEALARYMHAHPDLRAFLDRQRRSAEPMGWVNLACQHLPIAASARQKLLESDAPGRCRKISRGLDALLRKELGA
jgi:ATP-dependent Lon protease